MCLLEQITGYEIQANPALLFVVFLYFFDLS